MFEEIGYLDYDGPDDNERIVYSDIKIETEKAYLIEIDGVEYWLPKSQVEDHNAYEKSMLISQWFYNKYFRT